MLVCVGSARHARWINAHAGGPDLGAGGGRGHQWLLLPCWTARRPSWFGAHHRARDSRREPSTGAFKLPSSTYPDHGDEPCSRGHWSDWQAHTFFFALAHWCWFFPWRLQVLIFFRRLETAEDLASTEKSVATESTSQSSWPLLAAPVLRSLVHLRSDFSSPSGTCGSVGPKSHLDWCLHMHQKFHHVIVKSLAFW